MSRLRLTAGCCMLKLAQEPVYADAIKLEQFQTMALLASVSHNFLCRPVWAWERCGISPPHFLAEGRKRRLNLASFALLYFALFAFSEFYLICLFSVFLICLLSCIFQHKWYCIA